MEDKIIKALEKIADTIKVTSNSSSGDNILRVGSINKSLESLAMSIDKASESSSKLGVKILWLNIILWFITAIWVFYTVISFLNEYNKL